MYINNEKLKNIDSLFNAFYSALYDGVITPKRDYISIFDYQMTIKEFFYKYVIAFTKYRGDILSSDREIQAFCMAYMSLENNLF